MTPGRVTVIGLGVFGIIAVGALTAMTLLIVPSLLNTAPHAKPDPFRMTTAPGACPEQIDAIPRYGFDEQIMLDTGEIRWFSHEATPAHEIRQMSNAAGCAGRR